MCSYVLLRHKDRVDFNSIRTATRWVSTVIICRVKKKNCELIWVICSTQFCSTTENCTRSLFEHTFLFECDSFEYVLTSSTVIFLILCFFAVNHKNFKILSYVFKIFEYSLLYDLWKSILNGSTKNLHQVHWMSWARTLFGDWTVVCLTIFAMSFMI